MARKATTPETTTEQGDATPEAEATNDAEQAPVSVPTPADNAAPISGLLTAIAAATAEVKRIAKANDNKEQKYRYSSIDDFLAMTGPICATHGIVIVQQETGCAIGVKKNTEMVQFTYEFTIYHSATGQSLPPIRRTVEVYRTGAQATGAAQSYAQKTFLRGLLQIPTGDTEDPDAGHNDQPSRQDQRQQEQHPQQRQQEPRQNRRSDNWGHQQGQQQQQTQTQQEGPKRTAGDLANDLIAKLRTATTLDELEAMNSTGQFLYEKWGWLEDNGKQAAADMVQKAYAEHRSALIKPEPQTPPPHNDLDDEIPY